MRSYRSGGQRSQENPLRDDRFATTRRPSSRATPAASTYHLLRGCSRVAGRRLLTGWATIRSWANGFSTMRRCRPRTSFASPALSLISKRLARSGPSTSRGRRMPVAGPERVDLVWRFGGQHAHFRGITYAVPGTRSLLRTHRSATRLVGDGPTRLSLEDLARAVIIEISLSARPTGPPGVSISIHATSHL